MSYEMQETILNISLGAMLAIGILGRFLDVRLPKSDALETPVPYIPREIISRASQRK